MVIDADTNTPATPFIRIGAGHCGSVWTPSSPSDAHFGYAFKREDGGPGRSIRIDFDMQRRVIAAIQQFAEREMLALVPGCHDLIKPEDSGWWKDELTGRFPAGYTPCRTMRSERIMPVSEGVREVLIQNFCPREMRHVIRNSEADKVCIIRAYLGRRRFRGQQEAKDRSSRIFRGFSSRNYPLHVDQMETLQISDEDLVHYARVMARTLAVMHWITEIDANDVEFVFAPHREQSKSDGLRTNILGQRSDTNGQGTAGWVRTLAASLHWEDRRAIHMN